MRQGEIYAIAGVAGNGQRELAEVVTGMRPLSEGALTVDGVPLHGGDPRAAIRAGVAHVPEDRLHTGVAPSLSIASNVVLKSYRDGDVSVGPLLRLRRIRDRAVELVKQYDVRPDERRHPCPKALGREPAEGGARARVHGEPEGARRRSADAWASTSARSSPCTRTCATPPRVARGSS